MKETGTINIPVNLLETLVGSTRLSWIRFTCLLTLIVALLLSAALYMQGLPIRVYSEPTFIVTAYGLSTWFFIKPLLGKAVNNLKMQIDDNIFENLINFAVSPNYKRLGWLIIFGGGVIGILEHFRNLPVIKFPIGSELIFLIVNIITFVVLVWFFHTTITSIKLITKLVRQTTTTNIFDPTPFQPVAQWCLAVSLTIIGGLSLIILVAVELITDLVILSILISFLLLAGLVFIIGVWSTHQVMQENKQREINRVNELLMEIHEELLICVKERQLKKANSLLNTSSELCAHKKILTNAAEWPYTAKNIGSLVISALLPIIISVIKSLID